MTRPIDVAPRSEELASAAPASPAAAFGTPTGGANPWRAMIALVIGFFVIMIDTTIVSVATPALMTDLHAGVTDVVWVTSAYLLAYAVPLLITGRLGDRVGPKWMYLSGLAVFTLSSLWCGLSADIEMLIIARVFQGLGAAMMVPQTMAVITRIFPPERRGKATSLWGAVAGIAGLIGPILGGVLIDGPGWQWIFFVNLPVGVVGIVLAWKWVPSLPTHSHRFDVVGVILSAIGMFSLVFGIQEGSHLNWDYRAWLLIIGGLVVMAVFVGWQAKGAAEPLVPLSLFKDRNFSLANVAITAVGVVMVGFQLPFMLYAQTVRGLDPTGAALLTAPMAILSMIFAPIVGRLVDTKHPRYLAGFGMLASSVGLFWMAAVMRPDTPIWQILLPVSLYGLGNAFIFAPLGVSANRNLPMSQAGAGSGVFNNSRQVGAVLGSAGIAALMTSRLADLVPQLSGGISAEPAASAGHGSMPAQVLDGFSTAMGQSLLLPAVVMLAGFVSAIFLVAPKHLQRRR
ncbi:DHA2 family efflux MFS transporter permease subunit [Microlunatus elymi]|uniref:DHA2 family efflux MFS transporter permease subunit n=1 Tax=Microlunatus elymi TaxID=2596828 RepID=A0A516Q2L3_9ACTN|nr:DHA2 family efflux MFS transporter permease subunit [Microlunatus elymi]QDP97663.1 DHA2 family efflux MFS transporter permease subunit [Microlunatus elymi]